MNLKNRLSHKSGQRNGLHYGFSHLAEAVRQEMRSDGAYYSVIVVPEGIYSILSGIEGDTMGTVRKTGSEEQPPPPRWCWIKFTLFRV